MVTLESFAPEVRRRSLEILLEVSRRHRVAPAVVVSRIRVPAANAARKIVQQRMIDELRMTRAQVAFAFGRDLRRVRASVTAHAEQTERNRLWAATWARVAERAAARGR